MSKHPFRVAIEAGASDENFSKLFATDVVIHAPMLTRAVKGVRDVVNIIRHAAKLAAPIQYTLEVRDPNRPFFFGEAMRGASRSKPQRFWSMAMTV